jgi:transcriptional regulator with XRE-family HTH domain
VTEPDGRVERVTMRRFEPSSDVQPGPVLTEVGEDRKQTSHGRRTLGRLVAIRRTELGLTQKDLAVRMGVSLASIVRIEEGHPPSTDALRQLAEALPPEEGKEELSRWIERELHWRSPQFRRQGARAPQGSLDVRLRSLDGRWRWRGPTAVVLAAVLLTAGVIVAARTVGGGGDSSPQPAQVVSAPPAPPPVVEPQVKPQKEKNAQKSKSADAKPAPVSDSDESSASSPTSSDSESSSDAGSEAPVSAPVSTPSPAPSSSQSSGARPGLKHGIQGGGF